MDTESMADDQTNPATPAPNSVVQWYRSSNPGDQTSDDDLTLKLASQYPDTFHTYPDAVADYDRIIKQLQHQSLSASDYVEAPFKAAAGGFMKGVGSGLESLNIAAVSLDRATSPTINPDTGQPYTPEEAEDLPWYEAPSGKLAKFGKWMESAAPEPAPGLEDSFALSKVPGAIGSFAQYITAAGVGRKLAAGGIEALAKKAGEEALSDAAEKGLTAEASQALKQKAMNAARTGYVAHLTQNVPVALLGGAQSGVEGYKDAIANGADEATALGPAYWYNVAGGTTAFALPVAPWLDRMNKASGGVIGKSIIDRGVSATKSAGLGAAYGAATQFANNYIAQKYYDKDRDLLKDLGEAAGTNAAAAGLFDVVVSGISKALEQHTPEPPVKPPTTTATVKKPEPIKATQAYEMPKEQKDQVESIVNRELSGEQTPDLVASIQKIITSPDKNLMAYYLLRRQQLAKGIEKKDEPVAPPEPAKVVEQRIEEAKEAFQKSAEENGNTDKAKDITEWAKEEAKVEEPAPAPEVTPVVEPTPAPPVVPPAPLTEARTAAASVVPVEPEPAKAPAIPPAMKGMTIVKVQMPDGSVVPGGFNGYHDYSAIGGGVHPAVQVLNADGQWTGMPKEARVITKVPTLEQWKESQKASSKDLIGPTPLTNLQSYRNTPEELMKLVAVGSGEQQVSAQEVVGTGVGQKTEPAYRDTDNWEVAAKDSRADKDRSESRKLVVLASPDESHVLVSTIRPGKSGGKKTMLIAGKNPVTGETKTIRVENVAKTGYKLIGAIKSQVPTRDFIGGYSMNDWMGIREHLLDDQGAAQRTAIAMEKQLSGIQMPIYPGESEKLSGFDNPLAHHEEEEPPEGVESGKEKVNPKLPQEHKQAQREAEFRDEGEEKGDVGHMGSDTEIPMKAKVSSKAKSIIPTDEEIKSLSKSVILRPFDKAHAQSIISEYGGGKLTDEDARNVLEDLEGSEFGSDNYVALHSLIEQIKSGNKGLSDEHANALAIIALTRAANETAADPAQSLVESIHAVAAEAKATASGAASIPENPSLVARNRGATLVDPNSASSGRASDSYIARAYKSATDAIRNYGVDVHLIQQKIGEAIKEFGQFQEWKGSNGELLRAVTISAADHIHPTQDNLITAIHEAGHAVFSDERPETQVLLHKAISRMSNDILGIDGLRINVEAMEKGVPITPARRSAIESEERLVESVATSLAKEGFDPITSKGIAASIIRMVKQLYLRVAMKLADAFGFPPSDERALAYFKSRMESMLSGDHGFSFMTLMGGPRYTEIRSDYDQSADAVQSIIPSLNPGDNLVTVHKPDGTTYKAAFSGKYWDHPSRGKVASIAKPTSAGWSHTMLDVGEEIVSSLEHSYTRWRSSMHNVNDPRADISADLDATEVTKVKVALQNEVHNFLQGLYNEFNDRGYNTSNLPFEDFVRSGNFVRLPKNLDGVRWYGEGQLPKDMVAAFNQLLAAKGKQAVDENLSVADIPNPQWRERVQASAHRIIKHLVDDMAQRRMEADDNLDQLNTKSLFSKFKRDNENLGTLVKFYQDLSLITHNVLTRMGDAFSEAKSDLRKIGMVGRKVGTLEQVIRGLEDRQDDQVSKDYEGVIDRLYQRLSKDSDSADKFTDTLQRMAQIQIDWRNTPVAGIRKRLFEEYQTSEDFNLKSIIGADRDSKALLAMAITFAKQNRHVMQLLEIRKSNATEELPLVQKALQTAISDHKNSINEAQMLAAKLPKLKIAAVRLIQSMAELKQENRTKWDQLQRDLAFTKVHEDTRRAVDTHLASLERAAQIQYKDWQPSEGAKIPVWNKGATLDSVYSSQGKPLTLRSNGMVSEEVRGMIRDLRAGLDSVPADQRGARFNELEDVYRKLSAMDLDWSHREIKASLLNRIIAPLPDKIRYVGTPAARLASSMIQSMTSWEHARLHSGTDLGRKFEHQMAMLMRSTGLRTFDIVEKMFYQPALGWLEKRPDLTVSAKSDAEAQEIAIKAVVEHFQRDPKTAELLGRKGAMPAFVGMLRQAFHNSRWQSEEGAKDHRKVLDQSASYSVLRKALGSTPNTMTRRLSEAGELAFKTARDKWGGNSESKRAVTEEYRTSPDTLRQRLIDKSTPDVVDQFMRPWINRDGRSAFYGPDRPDGMHDFASRDNVIKAFDGANGDLVKFAEDLYQMEGGTTPIEGFVGETVSSIQSFYDLTHNLFVESERGVENGKPTPGRVISDARVSEELPKEFYRYLSYDRHTMHRMVQMQAYEIGMGRNIQAFKDVMDEALREQHDLTIKYNKIVDEVSSEGLTGRKLKVEVYRRSKELYPNTPALQLEQSRKNYTNLKQAMDSLEGVLTLNRNRSPELRPWLNLVRSMVGETVSGPGTFLTVLEHTIEQPFRIFGFGGGIKYLAGEARDASGVLMNSLLQTVGLQTSQDAFWSKKQTDLGMFDDDATATMMEKISTAFTHQHIADNPAAQAAQNTSQVVKLLLSSGVGRAIPGKAIYPTLKPGGFFQTGAAMIHMSNTTRFWKTYSSMVAGAVEHFQMHPEDYNDPNFKFSPMQMKRNIGWYANDRSWKFLHEKLAEYGVGNIEQVARDSIERRMKDGSSPLLTNEQFVKLAHLVQNEITMESNLGSRAPWFVSDPIGSLSNPLVGWAVEKTYAASTKSFRQPTGEGGLGASAALAWRGDYGKSLEALKGFRSGLMAFAAILPAALAYALMRDKYDEYIAGRKQNVLDLSTIHDPQQAVESVVDNVSRMGTLGLFGEAIDQAMVGAGQAQRPISLDSRIYFVNMLMNTGSALSNWIKQGSFDYQSVGRPMLQSLGGNGYLQYAAVLNNLLSLDNTEARVSNRISVNNYLRVAGKELGMDVNKGSYSSFNGATPNPVKPYLGEMVLAAYANDAAGFMSARREALKVLQGEGKDEKALAQAYAAYSPLKIVFRTEPDEQDYRKLLASMDDNGRQSTQEALRLFQHYGAQIGSKISLGKPSKTGIGINTPQVNMPSFMAPSLNDMRRMATAF